MRLALGGDWIPNYLVPIEPNPWLRLAEAVDPGRFFRFATVRLADATTLLIRDGEHERKVPITDQLLEVCSLLKRAEVPSVVVADRSFSQCWIAGQDQADEFVTYRTKQEDEEFSSY